MGLAGAGLASFAGLDLFALHLGWQVARIDPSDGAGALRLFRSNRDAGLILFAAHFSADKHREFYDEYLAVMDLTAEFYIQTIDRVFVVPVCAGSRV